jgi:hypothetical protein
MYLTTYYFGILARRRLGSPTMAEARRDFWALLGARLTSVPCI